MPAAADPPPDLKNFLDSYLSPLERKALDAISAGRKSGATLARELGMADKEGQANTGLRYLLANLCDRGVIESCREGYAISEPLRPLLSRLGILSPPQPPVS